MGAPDNASEEGRHLRLVHRGSGTGGRTVYAVAVGIVWLAIVWLLFVSFVDNGRDNRTTPPTKTRPTESSNVPQYAPRTRPVSTTGK